MKILRHEFVQYMPDQLEEGVIYISMKYRLAVHKCVCGCGNKVITPFSPTDWELRFYGDSISLSPSIGNWNFDCQSHYWIVKNQIKHAVRWNYRQISEGRATDAKRKAKHYAVEIASTRDSALPDEVIIRKRRFQWLAPVFKFFKRI